MMTITWGGMQQQQSTLISATPSLHSHLQPLLVTFVVFVVVGLGALLWLLGR
jgi:hypothetical protein